LNHDFLGLIIQRHLLLIQTVFLFSICLCETQSASSDVDEVRDNIPIARVTLIACGGLNLD
jgi:hypothetical protein